MWCVRVRVHVRVRVCVRVCVCEGVCERVYTRVCFILATLCRGVLTLCLLSMSICYH